jgi:hypothetical protein
MRNIGTAFANIEAAAKYSGVSMTSDESLPRLADLIAINPAEVTALRVIVTALVAILAKQYAATGSETAQFWINAVSEICQTSVKEIALSNGQSSERFRRELMEHINTILAGAISSPPDVSVAN